MTWKVYSTSLSPQAILVKCDILGLSGRITDYTKQEWSEAYFAPDNTYEWRDSTRIVVDGHVWIDGVLEEFDFNSKVRLILIPALASVEIVMFVTIIKNMVPILNSNPWLGAGIIYFFVTNIRAMNYRRFLRLLESNLPKLSDYIQRLTNKEVNEQ